MTLKAIIRYPTPDIDKSMEEIHKYMSEFIVGELKAWVNAVTKPIPVYSGAAKASFTYLATRVGVNLTINPVVRSRIPLGIAEADSIVFADANNGLYGWAFQSRLFHLPIVEDRVNFLDAGRAAIRDPEINLPQPIIVSTR